ncbi:TetR family transcriptional regulator [Marmoricola endophyticus]|uniref:TetR family transcriptional regulator n=1 Tax=Marmoricola endophyticus TaxID=2040280 RepID=A0A917BQL4_9ACTN|nr:TetR/AcrR family transcriptional regulator [Marmoricola endophyticus]GGF55071.1 TetR family transcriptional regulator [Marmoricola endophyticus]
MTVRPATRLSAEDWAVAGLHLLEAEGVEALQINRLCSELGVTRGSFYWHFADVAELRSAVAERWRAETRAVLEELGRVGTLPPGERLELMTLRLVDDSWWSAERAVRGWAATEDSVRTVVEESDRFALDLLTRTLQDVGHEPHEARVRAGLLVYAGIGFAHGRNGLPRPTEREVRTMMRVLAGPPDPEPDVGKDA